MSYPGQVFEDPDYYEDEEDFYYDLDDKGEWVKVRCDADGNPLVPETFNPFDTVNS